jgi:hypothetical protein
VSLATSTVRRELSATAAASPPPPGQHHAITGPKTFHWWSSRQAPRQLSKRLEEIVTTLRGLILERRSSTTQLVIWTQLAVPVLGAAPGLAVIHQVCAPRVRHRSLYHGAFRTRGSELLTPNSRRRALPGRARRPLPSHRGQIRHALCKGERRRPVPLHCLHGMNGQKIEAAAHAARTTRTNTQVSIDSPDVTRHDATF